MVIFLSTMLDAPFRHVCGAGVLAALLLDVAALAFRLGKPLTARLFPVPGKAAGEMTEFANPILCNTRVFDVP